MWTVMTVGDRLIESIRVHARTVRPDLKRGMKSAHPATVVEVAGRRLGADDTYVATEGELLADRDSIREWALLGASQFSPSALSRADEALSWLGLCIPSPIDRKILIMWVTHRAANKTMTKALRARQWSAQTFSRKKQSILKQMAKTLNGLNVPLALAEDDNCKKCGE